MSDADKASRVRAAFNKQVGILPTSERVWKSTMGLAEAVLAATEEMATPDDVNPYAGAAQQSLFTARLSASKLAIDATAAAEAKVFDYPLIARGAAVAMAFLIDLQYSLREVLFTQVDLLDSAVQFAETGMNKNVLMFAEPGDILAAKGEEAKNG